MRRIYPICRPGFFRGFLDGNRELGGVVALAVAQPHAYRAHEQPAAYSNQQRIDHWGRGLSVTACPAAWSARSSRAAGQATAAMSAARARQSPTRPGELGSLPVHDLIRYRRRQPAGEPRPGVRGEKLAEGTELGADMLLRQSSLRLGRRAPSAAVFASRALGARRSMCAVPGESGKIAVNGVDLFYKKNGDSGLPLLCMPGAMGAHAPRFGGRVRAFQRCGLPAKTIASQIGRPIAR